MAIVLIALGMLLGSACVLFPVLLFSACVLAGQVSRELEQLDQAHPEAVELDPPASIIIQELPY